MVSREETNKISHIYKNIFISDYDKASDMEGIYKNNIKAVLYLGSCEKPQIILDIYKFKNINYRFIKIQDSDTADLRSCFKYVWDFINEQSKKKNNIIIHCRRGVSRSPSAVAYFLMKVMHIYMKEKNEIHPILDDVLTLIHNNRPCIHPNKNFIKQLKLYEKKNIK
jgi:predicted protein tyrosine phosphatase